MDWDDTLLGTLVISKAVEDARAVVNWFVATNFVHPDLRPPNLEDPWAEERRRKRSAAMQAWPDFRACPVESITFRQGAEDMEVVHSLMYVKGARCRGL